MNLAQFAWAAGLIALVVSVVERARGDMLAPAEVKARLRSYAWGSRGLARYAWHEAPNPTRARLRRGGWASVVFLSCWTYGAVTMLGGFGLIGVAPALWLASWLVHKP